MEKEKIWLSPPHMSGKETEYLQKTIESNWVTQGGPNVEVFEDLLEKFLQNDIHATATTSGTAAIHLALKILDVQKDDFVICQSLTFVASANPIKYLGAVPVFVDSEPESWNLCPDALETAIKFCVAKGKKPKAIIAVALYGMPYKVDEITSVAHKYGIPVIEDSAEALGSRYKGKACGTLGDISVLSFNGNKIITTGGGGALVSRNRRFVEKAKWLSTQAREPKLYYEHISAGYNYRMSNLAAAVGIAQMSVLNDRIEKRRANHLYYQGIFEDMANFSLQNEPNSDYFSNYWLNTVIIRSENVEKDKMQLISRFQNENIEVRPLWKPMHLQPLYSKSIFFGSGISERLFDNGICLPSGSALTVHQLSSISAVFEFL